MRVDAGPGLGRLDRNLLGKLGSGKVGGNSERGSKNLRREDNACTRGRPHCRISARRGIVTLPGRLRFLWSPGSQQNEENQLQRLPVPTRDHSAGDLALPPVTLSLRDVEDLLAERGITVSYESIRRWINHFGPMIAADLRRRRPKPHTSWHLDEVYLKIDGRMVYLWRAVDTEGEILDVLVQSKRDKHAAVKLMRKLLKKYGFVPDRLITDDLRSYAAAARDLGIEKHHERGRWKNNRAKNSHQPTR
jgi:transposase-like protein